MKFASSLLLMISSSSLSVGCNLSETTATSTPTTSQDQPAKSSTEVSLKVISIDINFQANQEKSNDHEIIVNFNRPLTQNEVKPGKGYTHTYGIKYWIDSNTGWMYEPREYDIKPIQAGLTRNEMQSYLLTSESSHHPPRGYNEETDAGFNKENISRIKVELYKRDKNDRNSEYTLIQEMEIKEF